MDFTGARARTLARLTAYTLLAIFAISVVAAVLPLPLDAPERFLGVLEELLERSTLPLVGLLFLYYGLAEDSSPALWEVGMARWIRPLLHLLALLYLIVAIAVVPVTERVGSLMAGRLDTELEAAQGTLDRLQEAIAQAPDTAVLRNVLEHDPNLVREMERQEIRPGGQASLLDQQRLAGQLLRRAQANLSDQRLRRLSDTSGSLVRRMIRLLLTALVYSGFYAVAGFLWPRSVLATRLRLLDPLEQLRNQDDLDGGPGAGHGDSP